MLIFHPGSCTLRLGLSTQLDPHSIPHLIAYRNQATASLATPTLSNEDISILRYKSELTVSLVSSNNY